ncbi:MAG: hypothetical protein O7A71_01565, partial [Chloroflexi bacterium]|nr:hypothetical protein [Chloroflexota bacterium]
DNDLPTLVIVETNGDTRVAEGGASDSYTVALGNRPSETVTVQISVEGQVSVSPTTLTFTVANWQLTQRVTVRAVQDSVVEGEHMGSITHTASGSGFNGAALTTVAVVVTDDDRVESIALPAGLALVGWFGIPTTSRAIIDSNPLITSIWVWENADERWVLDSRLLPNSLRVVITITRGQGFFVVALAPTTLTVQVVE